MREHRFLVSELPLAGKRIELDEAEAHHALHVLRLETGAVCEALDGRHSAVGCLFVREKKRAYLEAMVPLQQRHPAPEETLPIVLEVACLKAEAMQSVIEKAVEIGVQRLRPVISEYTLGRWNPRWQLWADQALKQSGRIQKMLVEESSKLSTLPVGPRLWFDERADARAALLDPDAIRNHSSRPLTLLIGPEGGWSARDRDEIQSLGGSVALAPHSLGPNVLRAETAAISALSVCAAVLRSM